MARLIKVGVRDVLSVSQPETITHLVSRTLPDIRGRYPLEDRANGYVAPRWTRFDRMPCPHRPAYRGLDRP